MLSSLHCCLPSVSSTEISETSKGLEHHPPFSPYLTDLPLPLRTERDSHSQIAPRRHRGFCWDMSRSAGRLPVLALALLLLASLQNVRGVTYTSQSSSETCTASALERPGSAGEVSEIVKQAREAGQKVKVVGTRHASTDINCSSGVALDLTRMDKVEVNAEEMEVTVQTGATPEQVQSKLNEAGFTLIHPFAKYSGLSIGGILATGALSSSLKHPPSISDQVIAVTLVDGMGDIRKITGEDLKAVRVNIGYLGVIIDLTTKIVPNFKAKLEITSHDEDVLFSGTAIEWAKQADFLELLWYPHTRRVILLNATYVDINTPGSDRANFIFTTTPDFVAALDAASANRDENFFCGGETGNAEGWISGHPGIPQVVDESGAFKNPAIGLVSDILTNSCPFEQCAWNNPGARFLSQQIQSAVPLSLASQALQTIRGIFDSRPTCVTGINGAIVRYQRRSENYLSTAHGGDVCHFEVVQPLRQEDNQAHFSQPTFQEIYQTLLLKYNARSHWGKNARSTFADPFPTVQELYPEWEKFVAVKNRLDPEGTFENEFYQRMTRAKSLDKFEFCATDDKCVCSEDFHCAGGQKCEAITIGAVPGGVCID